MDVADFFVGASNFKALREHINNKNSFVLAVPGLTYQNNHKMQKLEEMIKNTLSQFKPNKVRFYVSYLLNSYFPGKPTNKHYLPIIRNNKQVSPLSPSEMAKKHVIFLEKLKSLVRGKVEIFTVPFASRKRNKCKSNCKICISYKSGVRQLWLLEKFIEKEFKKNDFILVSIHEWWTFFESNPKNGRLPTKQFKMFLSCFLLVGR